MLQLDEETRAELAGRGHWDGMADEIFARHEGKRLGIKRRDEKWRLEKLHLRVERRAREGDKRKTQTAEHKAKRAETRKLNRQRRKERANAIGF